MNPEINLLHLKYFCDSVVYNSVSEAAKINNVTQSAVSQAITKLERSIGASLIVHSRQKYQVTEDGKIVFDQARHIFKAVRDIQEKINLSKETVKGSLKFISTNSLGMSFIASSYQKMREAYPQVEISFQVGNLNLIRNAIRTGEAEFAIVVYDESFLAFNKISLQKGGFSLYQNKEAPLTLFENGVLIDNRAGMCIDLLIQNCNLKIQAELAAWEVVARFTDMKIGVGFLPDYILGNHRYPNLIKYPLELPSFEYEICAIYNKGIQLSRPSLAFLEIFKT